MLENNTIIPINFKNKVNVSNSKNLAAGKKASEEQYVVVKENEGMNDGDRQWRVHRPVMHCQSFCTTVHKYSMQMLSTKHH